MTTKTKDPYLEQQSCTLRPVVRETPSMSLSYSPTTGWVMTRGPEDDYVRGRGLLGRVLDIWHRMEGCPKEDCTICKETKALEKDIRDYINGNS